MTVEVYSAPPLFCYNSVLFSVGKKRLQEDKNCQELLAFLSLEKFLFFSLYILQT